MRGIALHPRPEQAVTLPPCQTFLGFKVVEDKAVPPGAFVLASGDRFIYVRADGATIKFKRTPIIFDDQKPSFRIQPESDQVERIRFK